MGKTKLQQAFVPDFTDFRIAMKAQRMRDGCNVRDVAKKIGCCPATIYNWESDPVQFRLIDLLRIMKAQNAKIEDQDQVIMTLVKELRKLA